LAEGVVAEHGEDDVGSTPCVAEDGLGVVFSLGDLQVQDVALGHLHRSEA
jgi:hypothetical protein